MCRQKVGEDRAVFKKKLKKIPADLVSYVQIESEAIQNANDKMVIFSCCLSKLEWRLKPAVQPDMKPPELVHLQPPSQLQRR